MGESRPILLTGAAGLIGQWLRPRLIEIYGALRSTDILDPGPSLPGEEVVLADLADAAAVDRLVQGVGRIIHLGAIIQEESFERILAVNIAGTYSIFDAARRHGAGPIIFASSHHAVGFYTRDEHLDVNVPPRPDSLYGVSKVFGEALAQFYADKYGIESACIRIGTARPDANQIRQLSTWISYDDLLSLIQACFASSQLGCTIVYGISGNDRAWWSNALASNIAYSPKDNAERFAAKLLRDGDPRDPEAPEVKFQGGPYAALDYLRRKS